MQLFAHKNLKGQEAEFKRLGVWGDWEHPYLTIAPEFEAEQIRVFGEMFKKGYVEKGLKPVYWCASCETALAEAEVEYADVSSKSIYVRFQFDEESTLKIKNMIDNNEFNFNIQGLTGFDLHQKTVGVIGTGKILMNLNIPVENGGIGFWYFCFAKDE